MSGVKESGNQSDERATDPWYMRDVWEVPIACLFGFLSGLSVSIAAVLIQAGT